MTPRVLQAITDTDRRGAQVFALDLREALAALGYSVRTFALAPGSSGGLDVPVLGTRRISATSLWCLRAEARSSDVVIAHGSSTLPACAIALAGTGIPFVYRQISDSQFWAPDAWRRAWVRACMARAAHVVALWSGSAETLHNYIGVPEQKVTVIPNGVLSSRFPAVEQEGRAEARLSFGLLPDRPTLLYVGALVPEKGVDLAISALARLPHAQLLVAGDGPERGRLEALADREARARVVFAGSVDRTESAFAAANVVVLPSRGGDSMPAVLIEAGLSGLPTVTTPVDGIPEIVVDGVTGTLVPLDDAASLAMAVEQLIGDRRRADELGGAARQRCLEQFAIDVVARRWAELLDEVARTPHRLRRR